MNRIDRIKSKLNILSPDFLEVKDESYLHKGHIEAADGEYTHLRITISDVFKDMKLIEKHRAIKNIINDEFKKGLHAVSIKLN